MADLAIADIEQQYANTVCFYKGKPHKVRGVGNKIKLLDLLTQKTKSVEFSLKDFTGPRTRLGFVNCDDGVVYVSRVPSRIMTVGINTANCRLDILEDAECPVGNSAIIRRVSEMECPEFGRMLLGHYPTLKAAFKQANEENGTVAFDRQFAVTARGQVYYRNVLSGVYNASTNEIKFNKGKEFLQLLIGKAYEQAARTFG